MGAQIAAILAASGGKKWDKKRKEVKGFFRVFCIFCEKISPVAAEKIKKHEFVRDFSCQNRQIVIG
jgi:hypothetical protein